MENSKNREMSDSPVKLEDEITSQGKVVNNRYLVDMQLTFEPIVEKNQIICYVNLTQLKENLQKTFAKDNIIFKTAEDWNSEKILSGKIKKEELEKQFEELEQYIDSFTNVEAGIIACILQTTPEFAKKADQARLGFNWGEYVKIILRDRLHDLDKKQNESSIKDGLISLTLTEDQKRILKGIALLKDIPFDNLLSDIIEQEIRALKQNNSIIEYDYISPGENKNAKK